MNEKEIKEYVIKTIQNGNKDRIQAVLKRYYAYLNKNDKTYEQAKTIFNV